MPMRGCGLPLNIRLRGPPDDERLGQMSDAIARTVAGRLAEADRAIAAREGWQAWQKSYAAPEIDFTGADIDDDLQRRITAAVEGGIARAQGRGAPGGPAQELQQTQFRRVQIKVPSPAPSGGSKAKRSVASAPLWHVLRTVGFRIRLDRFIDWCASLDNKGASFAAENSVQYREFLGTVRKATLWTVVMDQRVLADMVAEEVAERFAKFVPDDENFIYGYSIYEMPVLRLAAQVEGGTVPGLPEMPSDRIARTSDNQTVLARGGVLVFVAILVPPVELANIAAAGTDFTIPMRLRDLEFIINGDSFEKLFQISWRDYLTEFGDRADFLHVQTVSPMSSVHFDTLKLLFDRRVADRLAPDAAYFGNLYLLNQPTLDWLPGAARTRLSGAADDITRAVPESRRFGQWEPGWNGAFIYAVVAPSPEERSIASNRPVARRLTPAMVEWLKRDPSEFHWARDLYYFLAHNFGRNPPDARPADGSAFEFVLDELQKQNLFDTLFDKVEAAPDGFDAHQLVVRLALATVHAGNARVQRSLSLLGRTVLTEQRKNIYSTQPDAILLDREQDARVDVRTALGDVRSVFIIERDDRQLKSKRLAEFRDALVKEREDLIGRVLRGEDRKQYSEREFTDAAIANAAQRIKLTEDDFEKVKIQRSMRLLRVEPSTIRALPRFYVTFEFVERVEGEKDWKSVSQPVTEIDDEFEARLIQWRLVRAGEFWEAAGIAVTVVGIVAIGWSVGLVAVLVEAAGGTTAVLVSISITELLYVLRVVFGNEELSLRGFVEAAVEGYLMALGFRGAGFLGRAAARAIGTESLKSTVGGWVAERLIVGTVGGAGTAALTTFSHDLINVATGKGGWSGIGTYVGNMAVGAVVGIAIEFVGAPLLKSVGREALAGLKDARELARLIRAEGIGAVRWTSLMAEGLGSLHARLSVMIGEVAAKGFVEAMAGRLTELTEELGARFVSRRVLELAEVPLTRSANQGLEKLLGGAEVDPERALTLFNALADNPQHAAAFLEAVNGLDATAVRRLLARLGASQRLLALLTQDSAVGVKLLTGPFKFAVEDLERYLGGLEELAPEAKESVIRALLQDDPLPPDILLAAGRQGALDQSTLALLRRLRNARIRIEALFDGSGPSLKAFADEFAKLSEGDRAFALQLSAGRPPARILEQAARARGELEAIAQEVDPTPERLKQELEAGTRKEARAKVIRQQRQGPYQTAILKTVLKKNAQELGRMRASLRTFAPDAVVGAERGGPFIAEAATYGEPQLASRIVRIPSGQGDAVMAEMRSRIEALIAQGKRRFAFTEVFFSGSAVQKLQKDVIKRLAALHPECQFRGFWLRESLGFEALEGASGGGRPAIVPDPKAPSNVVSQVFDVPFAIGDDAERIIESTKPEPIYIFDSEGHIVEVVNPRADEKTARDTVVRILGEGGG